MGGHLELIWFGLLVAGIGAGFSFLFWKPTYEEENDHYVPDSVKIAAGRIQLLIVGLLVAALGLGIAVWHAVKLLLL
jgi:hypothetical protein